MGSLLQWIARWPGWIWPALAVVFLLAAWAWEKHPPDAPPAPRMEDWGIPDVLAHLQDAGLEVRAVSTREDGLVGQNIFLTTTDKDWRELNCLARLPERIDQWQGTLFVERDEPGQEQSVQAEMWGDCCLVAEPFIFFGDRALLERVRLALGEPPDQTARQ